MTKREEIREKIVDLIEHDAPIEEIALLINGSMAIIDKEKEELAKMKDDSSDWDKIKENFLWKKTNENLNEPEEKKTVFLSFPMRGRTHEAIMDTIETLTRLAKIYFGDDIVIRHNYHATTQVLSKHSSVTYLGLALREMAKCDYFFGCGSWEYKGFVTEYDVACRYNFEKVVTIGESEWMSLPCFKDVVENLAKERAECSCIPKC